MSTGKTNRRKGHDYERLIRRALEALGFKAKRNIQSQVGHDVSDITAGPFQVECKNARSLPGTKIEMAYQQAASVASKTGQTALLVMKMQGTSKSRVYMDWDEFCGLLAQLPK